MCITSISRAAELELKSVASESALKQNNDSLHRVEWKDIQELSYAGFGSFSDVFRVHVNVSGFESKEYALKRVSFDRLKLMNDLESAARDLVCEGEILSRISSHKNIISLHGITAGGPGKAFQEFEKGYFLLLDLLDDTLGCRLRRCRRNKGIKSLFKPSSLGRVDQIVLGVAEGIKHLHLHNIVNRDLKPDNIGFDSEGNPKIFDLGLAREVHMVDQCEVAGSLRYMAPECVLASGTSLASDVYSFGILFWEILTLDVPYQEYSSKEDFRKSVIIDGKRPSLNKLSLTKGVKDLLSGCWNHDPKLRPTFTEIVPLLEQDLCLGSSEFGTIKPLKKTLSRGTSEPTRCSVSPDSIKNIKPLKKPLSRGSSEPTMGLPPPSPSALRLGFRNIKPLRKSLLRGSSEPKKIDESTPTSSVSSTSSSAPGMTVINSPVGRAA